MVEFSASWCVYCRRLAPILEGVSDEYKDILNFGIVNADEELDLVEKEKIEVLPTLLLYHKGKILNTIIAPDSKSKLENFITDTFQENNNDKLINSNVYDVIVIGGGPAGYTSALYATRAGLKTAVIEKLSAGGQVALTEKVDNYPGFEAGIEGFELGEKMRIGAERFGAKTIIDKVTSVELTQSIKTVNTENSVFYGKTIILATGANPRKIGLEGEEVLVGRGLSYCATCDGMFYKDKTVVVAGGGNSAVEDALILSRICKQVILVHRRNTLRAAKIYSDILVNLDNVTIYYDTVTQKLNYDKRLKSVVLKNINTGIEQEIKCDGIFISIGRTPATDLVKGLLNLDSSGYVIADESTRTSIAGVFAVGDVRTKPVRQIVTAVSDGAVAVYYVEEFLANNL